jgi:hypothetical protein
MGNEMAQELISHLRGLRPAVDATEAQVQDSIAGLLGLMNIPFRREVKLGPGSRIDFLVQGGIGIEVKVGKPAAVKVQRQVERYCRSDEVTQLILLSTRGLSNPPASKSLGKPVHYISLMRERGLAI